MYSGIDIFPAKVDPIKAIEVTAKLYESELDFVKRTYFPYSKDIGFQHMTHIEMLQSKSRQRELVRIRKLLFKYLRVNTDLSLLDIGSYFNDRDHSTIHTSLKRFKESIEVDEIMGTTETIDDYLKLQTEINKYFRYK